VDLVRADARDGGDRAVRYGRLGAQIGRVVAAIDLVPSQSELEAIDGFRAMVHRTIDAVPAPAPPPGGGDPSQGLDRAATTATAGPGAGGAAAEPPELPPARPLDDLLDELDGLVGLAEVKREAQQRRVSAQLGVT